jgi:hypothetical protein
MLSWSRIFLLLGWCVVALIVSLLAWGATYSPSYQKCTTERANKESHAEQGDLHDPVISDPSIGVFLLCEGRFLDENNGTLTAIATIGIAGFTLTLWLATGRQARLTRDAIELGNREFAATHRPKIQVISFEETNIGRGDEHPAQEKIGTSLRYVNSGDTTAYLLEIGWHISAASHSLRPGVAMKIHDCRNQALESGEEGGYPLASDISVRSAIVADMQNERTLPALRQRLRCVGYVLYADANGKRRRTGFSRIHDASRSRWDRDENPDYEYSY